MLADPLMHADPFALLLCYVLSLLINYGPASPIWWHADPYPLM